MDKLRALATFVAVVDHGTLTRAADALQSSLPAVVRRLAALEAELGTRLLHRTTRRLSLTDEGRRYLERARRILADVQDADHSLARGQDDTEQPQGKLRITAPILFGQMHVAAAVSAFLHRHPGVAIELMLTDRVVNLVEEGFDVGVRIAPLEDSSLVARTVGRVRSVVVASPTLLRRVGEPRHPRELVGLPCLAFGTIGAHPWTFRDGGRKLTVPVTGRFACNLAQPILEACAAGAGFARFPAYQVAPYVAAGRLRVVLPDYEPPTRDLSLVFPSARWLPMRARRFVDAMVEALGRAPGVDAIAGRRR